MTVARQRHTAAPLGKAALEPTWLRRYGRFASGPTICRCACPPHQAAKPAQWSGTISPGMPCSRGDSPVGARRRGCRWQTNSSSPCGIRRSRDAARRRCRRYASKPYTQAADSAAAVKRAQWRADPLGHLFRTRAPSNHLCGKSSLTGARVWHGMRAPAFAGSYIDFGASISWKYLGARGSQSGPHNMQPRFGMGKRNVVSAHGSRSRCGSSACKRAARAGCSNKRDDSAPAQAGDCTSKPNVNASVSASISSPCRKRRWYPFGLRDTLLCAVSLTSAGS